MSNIPDCREDDFYNIERLSRDDRNFINGYDWSTEMEVDSFFDNLEDYFNADSVLMQALNTELPESMKDEYEMEFSFLRRTDTRAIETFGDLLRFELLSHLECERNDLIVSMIDGEEGE